jgi:hypothetical protein
MKFCGIQIIHVHTKTYSMFAAALVKIVQTGNNPKGHEQMND